MRQGVDVATDLAALVVNALADVKPEQAGQIAGFVTEQVLEQVLIILFTEGGGEARRRLRFAARIAAILKDSRIGAAAIERPGPAGQRVEKPQWRRRPRQGVGED